MATYRRIQAWVPRTSTAQGRTEHRYRARAEYLRGRLVNTGLRATRVRSTSARQKIGHGVRHTPARAGRRPRPCVANDCLRHMPIDSARVSKADGSQSLEVPAERRRCSGPRPRSSNNGCSCPP